MNNNILITGADGQAGQFMIKYCQDNQPQLNIIACRRHKTNETTSLIYDTNKVTYELMDLVDYVSIDSLVLKYKPAYFINFAANSYVGNSWVLPIQHMEHNCIGVLHQLEAIHKYSPDTHYFNSGSSEEFGCTADNGLQDEDTRIAPKSPYGVSKSAAHYLVDVYRKSYNIHATQNWTYNFESEIRGPQFVTKKITLGVARIKHAILNKEKFEPIELGNLDSIRSWQFAGDIVDAVWRTVNNSSPVDYVVSSDESHSIRELITTALNYANIPHYCTNDKYYSTTDNSLLVKTDLKHLRPSDVTVLKGNSNKIKNELSWQPTLNFDQLIKRMIEYDLKYVST